MVFLQKFFRLTVGNTQMTGQHSRLLGIVLAIHDRALKMTLPSNYFQLGQNLIPKMHVCIVQKCNTFHLEALFRTMWAFVHGWRLWLDSGIYDGVV